MVRQIVIRPVLNGFVVECGCETVVIQDGPARLADEIEQYYKDPEGRERFWQDQRINGSNIPEPEEAVPEQPYLADDRLHTAPTEPQRG